MDASESLQRKSIFILITLITALLGGLLFQLVHIPLPWMLGPMLFVLIGSSLFKARYAWSGRIRNGGMIVVGYTIGLSMTGAALREMSHQLGYMLLMTVLLLLLCAGIAFIVSKLSNTDYKTALLGSIPGGLTQVVVLAEETEGVNLTIVTVTQVIRLMMIIVCVPLFVFSPILGEMKDLAAASTVASSISPSWGALFPNIIIFAAVSVICALAGNRIKFPTAFLLGPAIGTAMIQMIGVQGPALPTLLINAAQLVIGAHVGLMLKPGQLTNKVRTITLALASGMMLVIGALGLSILLAWLQPVSISTALLSLAPGGMDQMGVMAHEIHADLSMVVGYQLFRAFFILLAIPPVLRMVFQRSLRMKKRTHIQK